MPDCMLTVHTAGSQPNTHVVSLVPQKVHSPDDLKRVTLPLRADEWQRRLPELQFSAPIPFAAIRSLHDGITASNKGTHLKIGCPGKVTYRHFCLRHAPIT